MDLGATDRMGQAAFGLRIYWCCQSWVALRYDKHWYDCKLSVGLPAAGGIGI
jgi:hypothetical protein